MSKGSKTKIPDFYECDITTNIYVYKAEHYTTAYDGERIG